MPSSVCTPAPGLHSKIKYINSNKKQLFLLKLLVMGVSGIIGHIKLICTVDSHGSPDICGIHYYNCSTVEFKSD